MNRYENHFLSRKTFETILYTSILFSDMRCRRLFRRAVVFTVSMAKSVMARIFVVVNALNVGTLGRRRNEELADCERGKSRDKNIRYLI